MRHDRAVDHEQPSPLARIAIAVPQGALVVLVGPSGAGKSTFARRHFLPTEILSSDTFRAMLTDDEADQRVSREAFALLHRVALQRLRRRRTTVVDATSVRGQARRSLLGLRGTTRARVIAIVFDVPLDVCLGRNAARRDRYVDPEVVAEQRMALDRALAFGRLVTEGFDAVYVLAGADAVDAAAVVRLPPG